MPKHEQSYRSTLWGVCFLFVFTVVVLIFVGKAREAALKAEHRKILIGLELRQKAGLPIPQRLSSSSSEQPPMELLRLRDEVTLLRKENHDLRAFLSNNNHVMKLDASGHDKTSLSNGGKANISKPREGQLNPGK
jgi:hypothetical protein